MSLLGNAQEYLYRTQAGSAALVKLIKTEKKDNVREVYEYKHRCCLEVEKRLKDLIILIGDFVKTWKEMEDTLNK